MKTVGIRELKDRLRAYLRLASSGETVQVTDRGKVVAELSPPRAAATVHEGLADLARRGLLTLATSDKRNYPRLPRALKGVTSAELLDADRGER